MDIKKVGVVGAGTMGNGIAQVFASAGYDVIMRDVGDAQLERGLTTIRKSLAKFVEKGKMGEADSDSALRRIETTTELSALAECDLVIEAVYENFEVKSGAFKQIDGLLGPVAILVSNTFQK